MLSVRIPVRMVAVMLFRHVSVSPPLLLSLALLTWLLGRRYSGSFPVAGLLIRKAQSQPTVLCRLYATSNLFPSSLSRAPVSFEARPLFNPPASSPVEAGAAQPAATASMGISFGSSSPSPRLAVGALGRGRGFFPGLGLEPGDILATVRLLERWIVPVLDWRWGIFPHLRLGNLSHSPSSHGEGGHAGDVPKKKEYSRFLGICLALITGAERRTRGRRLNH